ncbi:MAG: cell division topological specificity factor MinE [bacterium]|jgi:cell division topological specificity factor MinE
MFGMLRRRQSASQAKNRLQLVLSKDRIQLSDAEQEALRRDLHEVISRYFKIAQDALEIEVLNQDGRSALSVSTALESTTR